MSKLNYYFKSEGKSFGPVDADRFYKMISSGSIRRDMMVRKGEFGIWGPGDSFDELKLLFDAPDAVSKRMLLMDDKNAKASRVPVAHVHMRIVVALFVFAIHPFFVGLLGELIALVFGVERDGPVLQFLTSYPFLGIFTCPLLFFVIIPYFLVVMFFWPD